MTAGVPAAMLVSADLMFASRVRAAAERVDVTVESALGVDALWEKVVNGSPPLVILDLSAPGLRAEAIVPKLRELKPAPETIIAFGPHVQEELLRGAEKAGCDVVLSRGQFNAQMDALLKRYAVCG
jgi:DNA-binding NarL/FixJ family response regulator